MTPSEAMDKARNVGRGIADLLSPAAARIREDLAKERRERAERRVKDIRLLMSCDWGRRFVHDLLGKVGTHADTFHVEPIQMARLAGRRSVGTDLEREIAQCDPDAFLRMLREAFDANHA